MPWTPPAKENSPDHCEGGPNDCKRTDAKWVRINASYMDDKQNWMYLCPVCEKAVNDFYQAQWDSYNAGRL